MQSQYFMEHRQAPPPPHLCPKCGSHRTRMIGKSELEALTYVRCEACGQVSAVPKEEHD